MTVSEAIQIIEAVGWAIAGLMFLYWVFFE